MYTHDRACMGKGLAWMSIPAGPARHCLDGILSPPVSTDERDKAADAFMSAAALSESNELAELLRGRELQARNR